MPDIRTNLDDAFADAVTIAKQTLPDIDWTEVRGKVSLETGKANRVFEGTFSTHRVRVTISHEASWNTFFSLSHVHRKEDALPGQTPSISWRPQVGPELYRSAVFQHALALFFMDLQLISDQRKRESELFNEWWSDQMTNSSSGNTLHKTCSALKGDPVLAETLERIFHS